MPSLIGAEAELGLEIVEAAHSLVAIAPGSGDAEGVLAAYDDALNRLLVPAVALTAYGRAEDVRHVRLAVQVLAGAATDRHGL